MKNWIWNWIRKPWFEATHFIGKLGEDNGKIKLLIKKIEETTFNFSKNSVSIIWHGNTKGYKLAE